MSHVDSTSVPSEYANDPYKLAELLERQIDEIQALVAERKAMQDTLKEIHVVFYFSSCLSLSLGIIKSQLGLFFMSILKN